MDIKQGRFIEPSDSSVMVQWLDIGIATLTVSGSNLCGIGLSSTLTIDVDDVPALPIINGPNQVCLDTRLYTSSFDNNVFYNWSIGGTASLLDSINSAQIVFTDTGLYNLNLSLSNSCGTSGRRTETNTSFPDTIKASIITRRYNSLFGF